MSNVRGRSSWWPEIRSARQKVRDAVRRGNMDKPSVCEDCGEEHEARNLAGHHKDYANPLDVQWYCHKCHIVHNRKKGERVNQHE